MEQDIRKHEQGAILSEVDIRDYQGICSMSPTDFPIEFELPIVRIKNQKKVNSCVAHALSSVIEYYNYIQYDVKNEMSTGFIYGNRELSKHKDKGMIMRDAIATVCKYGDVEKEDFPYNIEIPDAIEKLNASLTENKILYDKAYPNRFSGYVRLKEEKDIKAFLLSKSPVVFAIKWYDDIEVADGIITTTQETNGSGHCMIIYGWNECGWKIQNSWGKNWGDNGTAILPYDIKIREAWGIFDNITDNCLYIKKPFHSRIGKIIAKIINYIINKFIKYCR